MEFISARFGFFWGLPATVWRLTDKRLRSKSVGESIDQVRGVWSSAIGCRSTVGKHSRYGGSARRVPRRGQGVHGSAKGTSPLSDLPTFSPHIHSRIDSYTVRSRAKILNLAPKQCGLWVWVQQCCWTLSTKWILVYETFINLFSRWLMGDKRGDILSAVDDQLAMFLNWFYERFLWT